MCSFIENATEIYICKNVVSSVPFPMLQYTPMAYFIKKKGLFNCSYAAIEIQWYNLGYMHQ